jgi:hypothetical protein
VKTAKPTGDAEVPPHVECAHAINDLMNEKAGSHDLDDQDIIDADPEVIEVSESEEKDMVSCKDDSTLKQQDEIYQLDHFFVAQRKAYLRMTSITPPAHLLSKLAYTLSGSDYGQLHRHKG